jgi:hypothetical protein
MYGTFEAVVSSKKSTVTTGDLMQSPQSSYAILNSRTDGREEDDK